eukprot:scaffold25036_cov64-Cyclotella_meneghiniana.AAC.5
MTGGTNNVTSKTLSADEAIGEINDANYSHCDWPPWRNRKHLQTFRPEAKWAAERSISIHTPWNVLGKADIPDGKARGDRHYLMLVTFQPYQVHGQSSNWV